MSDKPGPTGEFPHGKLRPDDEGGLSVLAGIDREKKVIVLDFTKPIVWVALAADDALRFATQLATLAVDLDPSCITRAGGQIISPGGVAGSIRRADKRVD